jgi:hypothetical protein
MRRAAPILADRKLYVAEDHADYCSVDSLIGDVIQSFRNQRKVELRSEPGSVKNRALLFVFSFYRGDEQLRRK